RGTYRALTKAGLNVAQEQIQIRILIVTARALYKGLRRDNVAPIHPKFDRVLMMHISRLVHDLVAVLIVNLGVFWSGPMFKPRSSSLRFGNWSNPGKVMSGTGKCWT